MKRMILIFTLLACLCLLAACESSQNDTGNSSTEISEDQYKTYAEQLLSQIVALDDATLESYISGGQLSEGLVSGLVSWREIREELGTFESVTETEFSRNEDTVSVVVRAKFSRREGTCTLTLDEEGNVTGAGFDKVYTKGEILKKAVLNTLMGMGTVFCVLIFIAFIISLFKYIPDLQGRFRLGFKENGTELVSEKEPVSFPVPGEELVDSGELAAVITAALYAALSSEGRAVSKDSLVVRSIRRAGK